jgi:hypothetical protein
MTGATPSPVRAGGALFGPLVWAAHFLIVYASESLLCRLADGAAHTALLAVATLLALAAVLVDVAAQRRRGDGDDLGGFIAASRIGLDLLSVLAILLVALAGLALPACSG